jgi:ABC-type multidrug transport system ATPase subunit
MYKADEGQIVLNGTPVVFTSPADAIAAGIGMVHQHFMLVPVFTVAENVVLGVEPTGRLGSLDIDKAREMVREVSDRYNLNLDPDAIIEDLPVGVQQRVEIVKVLLRDAKVVVFDEPTAVLTPKEIIEFFEIVKTLIAAGRGVVFITHKLKEALNVADRIAVLRRGQVVGEVDPKNATRHPRSILGVNAAGDRLWLVTIDGRQKGYSEGASFAESALILQALGAANAINLDGGGSTALVFRDPVRGPQVLNRPIQSGIPGTERPVATHIGVFTKAKPKT